MDLRANVVDDDGNLEAMVTSKDMLQQRRFASAQEPGEEGDGQRHWGDTRGL